MMQSEMTLKRGLAPGEYYHVFNRGAHRIDIFRGKADMQRFLFEVLYFQSHTPLKNVARLASSFSPEQGFAAPDELIEKIIRERTAELVAFCIMPNHFHLLLRELEEGSVENYMQRISEGYTKYFHKRYGASGHVFQGRYKTVHVKTDEQLMHLSAYIHRNPRELRAWKGREERYPWSSLQDFTVANRWGGLIAPEILVSRFDATPDSNYADFVRTSPAKLLEEEFGTRRD